jgi:hypothetical protein
MHVRTSAASTLPDPGRGRRAVMSPSTIHAAVPLMGAKWLAALEPSLPKLGDRVANNSAPPTPNLADYTGQFEAPSLQTTATWELNLEEACATGQPVPQLRMRWNTEY